MARPLFPGRVRIEDAVAAWFACRDARSWIAENANGDPHDLVLRMYDVESDCGERLGVFWLDWLFVKISSHRDHFPPEYIERLRLARLLVPLRSAVDTTPYVRPVFVDDSARRRAVALLAVDGLQLWVASPGYTQRAREMFLARWPSCANDVHGFVSLNDEADGRVKIRDLDLPDPELVARFRRERGLP